MTLKALKESIEHWERMRDGTSREGEFIGGDHCALCKIYALEEHLETGVECEGCPVMEYTGKRNCGGTPWAYISTEMFFNVQKKSAIKGAPSQKMVDFLNKVKRKIYDH